MPWIPPVKPFDQSALTQNICTLTLGQIASAVVYSGQQATPVNTSVQITTGGGGPSGGLAVGNVSTISPGSITRAPMLNVQHIVLINQITAQLTRFPSA